MCASGERRGDFFLQYTLGVLSHGKNSSRVLKIMKILLSILLSYTLSEAATQHMNENVKYTIANAKNPEMEYSFRDSSSYFEVETTSLNTTYVCIEYHWK